jgi:hypothetical protein
MSSTTSTDDHGAPDLDGLRTAMTLVDDLPSTASVGALDDAGLRRWLVDIEAARNALEAAQADVVVEMTARAKAEDARLDALLAADQGRSDKGAHYLGRQEEFITDEVAALLGCTRSAAAARLESAMGAARHSAVAEAWRDGLVDGRKVRELSGAADQLDQPDSVGALALPALLEAAISYARSHTAPQLRAWLERRVIEADPAAAERRCERASSERRVVVTPGTNGMSDLWAWLPSVQARQIQQILTAAAHAAGADDQRTMDQRRADALVDLICGRTTPLQVQLAVTVPADVLAGECDEPGWLAGVGPITARQTRELLGLDRGVGVWALDPTTGGLAVESDNASGESRYRPSATLERQVRARDMTCRFPGCRRAAVGTATGTDLDHTVAWPGGDTALSNLAVLCRRHHRLKHTPQWDVEIAADGSMTWRSPGGSVFTTQPWEYASPVPLDPLESG